MPRKPPAADPAAITPEALAAYRAEFEASPRFLAAMNAATNSDLEAVALNRRVVSRVDWHFSHEVPTGGITAQQNAGTCWIYAGLNWLRKETMRKLGAETFQYSQNYLAFYDKLEKANAFLHRAIETADRPLADRGVHHLLSAPVSDGGDWPHLADLIDKYGVVPRDAMGDTHALANSAVMNRLLNERLRKAAADLRARRAAGARPAALRAEARRVLGEVHRVLCVVFGEPPGTVSVAYKGKGAKSRRRRGLTPTRVFKEFVGLRTGDYVHLVSSPLPETPYGRPISIPALRYVAGAAPRASLNVPVEKVRSLALKALKGGRAVFFDSDVTAGLHRPRGVLDPELYDFEALFGIDLAWPRAERMAYLQQRPTHCMVFVGVDLEGATPRKWKVENSWGEALGEKGLFQCSDAWFEEHVYGILTPKKDLGKRLVAAAAGPPITLPAWHTLG